MKNKLEELSLNELHSLYSIVCELCGEYVKMTDNYILATGERTLEKLPEDIDGMIRERQLFISYKIRIQSVLVKKIIEEMDKYE